MITLVKCEKYEFNIKHDIFIIIYINIYIKVNAIKRCNMS